MSQTSYTELQSAAIAGMKGDQAHNHVVDSKISKASSASIPMGAWVVADGSAGVDLPAATSDLPAGVVLHSMNYAPAWTDVNGTHGELDSVGLVPGAMLNVMKKGRVWVVSETNWSYGDNVFVRAIAAGAEKFGATRNAADASDCIDMTGKARYISADGLAGALALIEIDLI